LILDEPSVLVSIGNRDDGYVIHAHVELTNLGSATDTLHLDWKQGGKLIQTVKCKLERDGKYGYGYCDYDDKPLKTKGPIDADLVYWDDQAEKDYLVRTFKLNVVDLKGQWETWQIVPDDVLAAGWIYLGNENSNDGTYRLPALYLWFSNGETLGDAVLRCTVDGKKKLADISLSPQGGGDTGQVELDHQPKNGERMTYRWQKAKFLLEVKWGKRETLKWDMPKNEPKDRVLSDNPGKWECGLRHDGKTIRQLLFTVDKDGMILPDEMQSGKGAIPVVSSRVALIDLRLTKDSQSFDKRIVPAALKKSMGFGLPWPGHPKVKNIQGSFPAKSGLPDPK
jgi:hypothetical protein